MDKQFPAVDLLIVGGSGFIGARAAQAALSAGLRVACTARSRPVPSGALECRLDANEPGALLGCLERTQPQAVIYAALSWELDSEEAQMRVSAQGLRVLAAAMKAAAPSARLVYVSTNAVFSGRPGAHKESEPPDPEARFDAYRFYGLARRAGELAALEGWPNAVVARTANVDGRDAWGSFNKRLLSLLDPLRAGQPLARFVDRIISPTLVDSVAEALVEVAQPSFPLPPGGILHLSGSQPASDFQYACRLARAVGADPALVREDRCLPPGSAAATYDISLDTAFTQSLLKTRLLDLDAMVERMVGAGFGN